MTCSSCNSLSQANDRFCTHCGQALFHVDESSAVCPDGKTPSFRDFPLELIRSHQLAGMSDRGRWHSHNEDAIAVEHLAVEHLACDSHSGRLCQQSVLIVCDGVSSSTHPENASATAATIVALALAADLAACPTARPIDALTSAMSQAQHAVACLAEPYSSNPHPSNPYLSKHCLSNPPATTIVAAVIQTDDQAQTTLATIGWLGDSRAYWISSENAQLLTCDDSWLNAIRISGQLSEIEALRSPYVHAITRWLGANADHQPSLIQVPLDHAGYLILCSDGFWNYAAGPDRVAELCQRSSLQSAASIAQTLVHHALSCGGRDNISVAVYYHEPSPEPSHESSPNPI